MPTIIRLLRLLAIIVWVGGIIFFAFVLAPVAFSLLPSPHVAGIVVGGTLRVLDILGLCCGGIFWIATAILFRQSDKAFKGRYEAQILLASIMLLATAYLQFNVLPAMENDRQRAGGSIEAVSLTDASRSNFERLHQRSEHTEGAVLICGLGIVFLMARESLQQ